jgi:hypothetical protein
MKGHRRQRQQPRISICSQVGLALEAIGIRESFRRVLENDGLVATRHKPKSEGAWRILAEILTILVFAILMSGWQAGASLPYTHGH